MTDEEVIKDYWKREKEMKSKITKAHTDGYNRGLAKAEEKIADLKANFDYVLKGKDLEIKQLGERCNQLLKDKGNLTDELQELKETLAQTIENDEVVYETLKLHDQEEIGMLNSKVTDLENKIADIKANCDLAIEGRDIKIKELEKEVEKHKWNDIFLEDCAGYDKKIAEEYSTLQERNNELEQQIEKMKCCENCKHKKSEVNRCELLMYTMNACLCKDKDKWELEND